MLIDLFFTFAKIGMFTFGGGYAMISLIENTCVENKKWITHDEMMTVTVIAESTPGPIAINCATYVGYKKGKLPGAIVATLGMVLPSFVIIYLISKFLNHFLEITWVANAFKGIKIAVGILVVDVAIKMLKLKTFNSFDGKADMKGKQYLLELTAEKYPVIPTVDSVDDISILPKSDLYVIKPKDGADSIGLDFVTLEEINGHNICPGTMLIQPAIDFQYEVSFYFIDEKFEYALYAPDKLKRWKLKEYDCTDEDIAFAREFIEWNTVTHGIQRVDACRTKDGELLLVELEDLNPYLSILEVEEKIRYKFLNDMMETLEML